MHVRNATSGSLPQSNARAQGINPETGKYFVSQLAHNSHVDIYNQADGFRKTTIVCTIGPVTNSPEALATLRKAGLSIMRMNFSHGTHDYHASVIDNLRKSFELEAGRPVAIALDTKGPEIRSGLMLNGQDVVLEAGKTIVVSTDEAHKEQCTADLIYMDYLNLPSVVAVGSLIFIDDGLISLKVLGQTSNTSLKCEIVNSGALSSRKGVNLPNTDVDLPAVSEKDKRDLLFGVDKGVDMVFASFIRKAADVQAVRAVLGEKGANIKIISKIENHEGVRNYDEILAESDGIMVARGDLGIEIPPEKVFLAQKMMIARANIVGKPVICATQMLESMTENPRPTRAEASDVANAVLDGADCVMLSGETAKGKYPRESVAMMSSIAKEAEAAVLYPQLHRQLLEAQPSKPGMSLTETIASAAVSASLEQNIQAILCLTTSGSTARVLSKYRPRCPILVITRNAQTARQMHLHRACIPIHYQTPKQDGKPWEEDVEDRFQAGVQFGIENGFLEQGDSIVVLQGAGKRGVAPTMRMVTVLPKQQ